ncbi:hypothetical protein JCM8547_003186 [Rhodosporidiobolus lusitaniae]
MLSSDVTNNTNSKWWRDPGLRKGMFHIFVLYSVVFALGYDGSLLTGLQALPTWKRDFNSPAGYALGLISASYFLPKIITPFFVSAIADRWGRKITLYIGAFLMIAGSLVGTFSQSRGQLIGSRIILGVGTVTAQLTAISLIPELAHPRIRGYAGSYLNTVFYIGSITAAWTTFAMLYWPSGSSWNWRLPTLIQALGPFFLAIGVWFVPQSPRWLIKQGRSAEAHQILAKYHANGGLNDELVLLEVNEITTAVEMEKLASTSSYKTFVTTSGGRRRLGMIILVGSATQLVGNGLVSYYLVPILRQAGITSPAQQAGINGGLAIWNWLVSMLGASLVERAGRRVLFLTSLGGMFVAFVAITGLAGGYATTKLAATGIALIPFLFVFMGFYSVAMTPLPHLYVPEISPLSIRTRSVAIYLCTGSIAQTFNAFVNPIALAAIDYKYYAVYVAVLLFYICAFYFFCRETRGLTIEESAVIYESASTRGAAYQAELTLRAKALEAAGGERDSTGRKVAKEEEHLEDA